jgi:hypothetical protein
VFSKEYILKAHSSILDEDDKRYLLEKYFPNTPESIPTWKHDLREKYKELNDNQIWASYYGQSNRGDFAEPYRFTHTYVTLMARNKRPIQPRNRVTDFTSWIMSLYLTPPNSKSLKAGKSLEKLISTFSEPIMNNKWSLVYKDPLNGKPDAFKISSLRINSSPIWGAPDLVYKNKVSDEYVIIERKSSYSEIPSDGWPNLKAQLWAYSLIDEFQETSRIHLVGEIWGNINGNIARRGIMHWDSNDQSFNKTNEELFNLYGGHIHNKKQ